MKLEDGKTYLTRDGQTVTVQQFTAREDRAFKFTGVLEDDVHTWREDGRWSEFYDPCRLDLIAPVAEQIDMRKAVEFALRYAIVGGIDRDAFLKKCLECDMTTIGEHSPDFVEWVSK